MHKKLTYSLIAFALIIVSVVLFTFRGNQTIARTGIGSNEKIENVGELYDVTEYVLDKLNANEIQDNSKYESATVHISLSETINVLQKAKGAKASEKISIEQELTFYFDEDGIYIESQAAMFTNAKSGNDSARAFAKYNVNIYLTNDKSYIKIIDYNVAGTASSTVIKAEYVDQWIETTRDVAFGFLPLEFEMEFALEAFAYSLDALLDGGKIKNSDTSVSFDEDDLADLDAWELEGLELDFDMDDYREDLKIDLSDKTRPCITMNATYKNKDIQHKINEQLSTTTKITTKIRLGAAMEMVISNVNNTIIDWKISDKQIVKRVTSLDNLEQLFVIKKYQEADDE